MSLELMRRRLKALGGVDAEDRLISEKLKTLNKALLYSYQGETIVLNGKEMRALLNSNKLKMDYDDKLISIPFDSGIKVGDLFYWGRTGEYWIVYLRQFSEDAYFRGYARKAQHTLRWKNKYGKELEVLVAVRGPVETKIKTEQKAGLSYDSPNYTLSIIAPNNDHTSALKRYSKVELDGEEWEVTVTDRVSEVGVIDVQLVERLSNKDTEGEKPLIEVKTNLDKIECVEVGRPLKVEYEVYVNGEKDELLKSKVHFSVDENSALFRNENIIFHNDGMVSVKVSVEGTDYVNILNFKVAKTCESIKEYLVIEGNETVKSYGTTVYKANLIRNGDIEVANGEWEILGDNLFTIKEKTEDKLTISWKSGLIGKIRILYKMEGYEDAIKEVNVTSLL